jgi:NTE family protein
MIFTRTLSADAALSKAPDYAAWVEAAQDHDAKSGMQSWRDADESDHYDFKAIRARLEKLRGLSAAGDVKGLLFVLNEGIHGNIDGMGHERLYQKARFGTKKLIEDYIAEIVSALRRIAASRAIPLEDKRDFFRRAQHCYGRSALLLSGSGSFLFFHIGVAKAMWTEGVLPNILAGSSGGSIVAATICARKDSEIAPFFESENLARAERDPELRRLAPDEVRARLTELIPDLTFQEAYEISGACPISPTGAGSTGR